MKLIALLLAALVAAPVLAADSAKPLRGFMKKYDTNKDGKLDDSEKAAMKADMAKRREAKKASDLAKYDTNKDGKLDKAERAARKADKAAHPSKRALKKYDKDNDGKLSESEQAAMKADRAAKRKARKQAAE